MAKSRTRYRIGRDPRCDFVVDADTVSSTHAYVEPDDSGAWRIQDAGSTNGTRIDAPDGDHLPAHGWVLRPGHRLYLGHFPLATDWLLGKLGEFAQSSGERKQLRSDQLVIGRDPACDWPIDHPSVSFRHARFRRLADRSGYELEDLGSTNGTYVNGERIEARKQVGDGDEIAFGTYSFVLSVDQARREVTLHQRRSMEGLTLEARNVGVSLNADQPLLDDISLSIYPGELVGMVGLSGAGKTTLLKALSGNWAPDRGFSLINGQDLYQSPGLFDKLIGYLPQEDICHRELTVREALTYYAWLRLPQDTPKEEVERRVRDVLVNLGLSDVEHTVIGSPESGGGISGGQRKRVNLAMELLVDPKILFLDEPTSGLSAVDAKRVMDVLRDLANQGKTILLTLHQPSLASYRQLDQVVVLTHGKLAYYGPAYPDSIAFFNPALGDEHDRSNPDQVLIGLHAGEVTATAGTHGSSRDADLWPQRYRSSEYYQGFVQRRRGEHRKLGGVAQRPPSAWRQVAVLANRYLRIKLRDRMNTTILLAQAPLIGLLIGLLFSESAYAGEATEPGMVMTLLFVFAIAAVWFGTINACREIVDERAIFERERRVGLRLLPYVMAKYGVLAVLCAIQAVTLIAVAVWVAPYDTGLAGAYGVVLGFLFLAALSGVGIGLLISSVSRSPAQAVALVPIVVLPMILFGGGLMPLKEMAKSPNPAGYGIAQAMPTRWALEGMTHGYMAVNDARAQCEAKLETPPEEWPDPAEKPDPEAVAVPEPSPQQSPQGQVRAIEQQVEAVQAQSERRLARMEAEQERQSLKRVHEICLEQRERLDAHYGEQRTDVRTAAGVLLGLALLPLGGVVAVLRRS